MLLNSLKISLGVLFVSYILYLMFTLDMRTVAWEEGRPGATRYLTRETERVSNEMIRVGLIPLGETITIDMRAREVYILRAWLSIPIWVSGLTSVVLGILWGLATAINRLVRR